MTAIRAAAWAIELVGFASVNGTEGEAAFAPWLAGRLAASPAFAARPDHVWTIPVEGCPLGRASVAALLPGSGPKTLVLTGHFDTVSVENYAELAAVALRPLELRDALVARLRRPGAGPAAAAVLADLEGGAFLPGRGLLDMKAGLAAGLAAIEAWANRAERPGGILFLAVPDEEAASTGARSAVRALPAIAARFGLEFEAIINLDALVDDGDGALGRRVALGTVGKLLPSALVVGVPVHAADALRGMNAAVLASRIAAAVEWAPGLTDQTDGEWGAPPTLLTFKDNRTAYDVTTPDKVWLYWNVLTHRRGPAEILTAFHKLCRGAADDCRRALAERASTHGWPTCGQLADVPVLTFAALHEEVVTADPSAGPALELQAAALAKLGLDVPEQCRRLTERLFTLSGRLGPAVVVGFASVPYLPTRLAGEPGRALEAAVRRAVAAVAERLGTSIGIAPYMPGISDISFLGQPDLGQLPTLAANTPAWRTGVAWPDEQAVANLPAINAGPWGRDYHNAHERLHAGYAFDVLPELLLTIVEEAFVELLRGEVRATLLQSVTEGAGATPPAAVRAGG